MGDSGEGLIDNEARIQERMEELRQNRERARMPAIKKPEFARQLESLELARKEIIRALESATHPVRKTQLTAALADIDARITHLK
jgi:hypothetical protein